MFAIENLAEQFELLYSAYSPSKTGPTFVDWLQDDWLIFDGAKVSRDNQEKLVAQALGQSFATNIPMTPIARGDEKPLARWSELKIELKEKNRYFFDQSLIDIDRLSDLLDFLLISDLPERWFRGRITDNGIAYSLDQMGAPPGRLASHGRANPPGIPYLYLASQADTAASEIRPHTGEDICVAEFALQAPILAVDLRNPKKHISPFILSDTLSIVQLRNDIPFIERLGEELTRPVVPKGAAIDYIPTQFLCEYIKKRGYDGVVYRSSMSDGFNLALFDPNRATANSTNMYRVTNVKVSIDKL